MVATSARSSRSAARSPSSKPSTTCCRPRSGSRRSTPWGVCTAISKPANLFIAEAAGTRTLKVLDLGLVKESSTGLTSTGHSFGTPHYMSPEQIRESKSVDARSDIWALGVILFELLTRSLPFAPKAMATGEVFGAILHTDPVRLRSVRPELSAELQEVIDRCLRRNPDERFQDLGALARALGPFAGAASRERVDAVREALRLHDAVTTSEPEPVSAQPTVRAAEAPRRPDPPGPVAPSRGEPAPVAPVAPVPPRIEYSAVPAVSDTPPAVVSRRPTLVMVAGGMLAVGAAVVFAVIEILGARGIGLDDSDVSGDGRCDGDDPGRHLGFQRGARPGAIGVGAAPRADRFERVP